MAEADGAQALAAFAQAKDSLRDTMKWLAAALTTVVGAVLVGASVTGLADVATPGLYVALAGALVGLGGLLWAIWILLRLLTTRSFYLSDLALETNTPLRRRLDGLASDILPPQVQTIDTFLALRATAMAVLQGGRAGDPGYDNAKAFYDQSIAPARHLLHVAQLEKLRSDFVAQWWTLLLAAVLAIAGLGVFAVFGGKKPAAGMDTAAEGFVQAELAPGGGWSAMAAAMAGECGDQPMTVQLLPAAAKPGWVSARILPPFPCAGLVMAIPARTVLIPAPAPARPGRPASGPAPAAP